MLYKFKLTFLFVVAGAPIRLSYSPSLYVWMVKRLLKCSRVLASFMLASFEPDTEKTLL